MNGRVVEQQESATLWNAAVTKTYSSIVNNYN